MPLDATTTSVSGLLWQRYADTMPKEVIQAVVLPQQIDGAPKFKEMQRIRVGKPR